MALYLIYSILAFVSGVTVSKECQALSMGTSPHYFDIVTNGSISEEFKTKSLATHRTVTNRESEYFYVQFSGAGELDDGAFNVVDQARDLYMTLFKVTKVKPNYLSISFLYICSPMTHSINEIALEIKAPGCDLVTISWLKQCGDVLSRMMLT